LEIQPEKPLPLIVKGSFLEQLKEENQGEWANPGSSGTINIETGNLAGESNPSHSNESGDSIT